MFNDQDKEQTTQYSRFHLLFQIWMQPRLIGDSFARWNQWYLHILLHFQSEMSSEWHYKVNAHSESNVSSVCVTHYK